MRLFTLVLLVLVSLILLAACARPGTQLAAPVITGISPASGLAAGGTRVTISGTGFFQVESGQFPGSLAVSICGVPLQNVQLAGTSRRIVLPGGASASVVLGGTITGTTRDSEPRLGSDVTVRLPDGQTATLGAGFSCLSGQPVISSFTATPATVAAGEPVNFEWQIDNPAATALSCTLNTGSGAVPISICGDSGSVAHAFTAAGTYTVLLTVESGGFDAVTAEATIIVSAEEPVAADDSYALAFGATLEVPAAAGVLVNDTGLPAPTVTAWDAPLNGVLTGAADGSFSFEPDAGFTGIASFDYTITNAVGTDNGTVTVTVGESPSAAADQFRTLADTRLDVPAPGVLANDQSLGAILSFDATSTAGGSVIMAQDGSFSYQPPAGFTGPDSFGYLLQNGLGVSTATVSIEVAVAVNAADDVVAAAVLGNIPAVLMSGAVPFDPLENDTGSPLVVQSVRSPTERGGSIALTADGTLLYLPPAGYLGTDTFEYTISDGFSTSTAEVRLTVGGTIWFVDSTVATSGDGRLDSPFQAVSDLPPLNTDEVVFFMSGAHSGAPTLASGVRLIGSGAVADLDALLPAAWPIWPPGTAKPASGTATLALGSGNVQLAADNQLHGLVLTGTSAAEPLLTGTGFGDLTVSDLLLDATGRAALSLTDGSVAGSFSGINSSGGVGESVLLWQVGGELSVYGGNISNLDAAVPSQGCISVLAGDTVNLILHMSLLELADCGRGVVGVTNGDAHLVLDLDNSAVNVRGDGVHLTAYNGSSLAARIRNSIVQNTQDNDAASGFVASSSDRASVLADIRGSTFSGSAVGIHAIAAAGIGSSTELTLLGNTIETAGDFALAGIYLETMETVRAGEHVRLCFNVRDNTVRTSSSSVYLADIAVFHRPHGSSIFAQGMTGSGSFRMVQFLQGNNLITSVMTSISGDAVASANCNSFPHVVGP